MWYELVSEYYRKGYYSKEDVHTFVPKFITEEECQAITQ